MAMVAHPHAADGGAPARVRSTPRPTLTSTTENPMIEAANEATTNKNPDATLMAKNLGKLQPTSCEYVGADEILISLKTATGSMVSYSVKTSMLVHMVNLSVALINNCTGQVFRDLGVL
jgi:hypothetical protein